MQIKDKEIYFDIYSVIFVIEFVNIETCKFYNDSGKIGAVYNYLFKNNKIDDILLKNSSG